MDTRWRLDGMRALVTGGTKGIGLAITKEFLDLGAEVAVVSRRSVSLADPFDGAATSGRLHGVAADVSTADGRARVVDGLPASWDALDILVNNVGTNIRKPSLTISDAELRTVFETNLTSAWDLSRALQPRLAASGRASLVNIGSVAGMRSVGSGAAYAMSKAALAHLTRYLSVEWAPDRIRVNMVSPWYTRTPLAAPVLNQPDVLAAAGGSHAARACRRARGNSRARGVSLLARSVLHHRAGDCGGWRIHGVRVQASDLAATETTLSRIVGRRQ